MRETFGETVSLCITNQTVFQEDKESFEVELRTRLSRILACLKVQMGLTSNFLAPLPFLFRFQLLISANSQYISGRFSSCYRATIGADFITKTLPNPIDPEQGTGVVLQIWVSLSYSLSRHMYPRPICSTCSLVFFKFVSIGHSRPRKVLELIFRFLPRSRKSSLMKKRIMNLNISHLYVSGCGHTDVRCVITSVSPLTAKMVE